MPIRLNPNITNNPGRSNLKDTYSQIISDLDTAKYLISDMTIGNNRIRPGRLTVYALLARIYLAQRNYEKAGNYADSVLIRYNTLMDYNHITSFTFTNEETLYQNIFRTGIISFSAVSGILNVDSVLYNFYDQNDLRKTLYYGITNGRVVFKRSYNETIFPFSGLATDEMYLIRAECYARSGNTEKAAKNINDLLIKRYITDTYTPVTFSTSQDALSFVLRERRKELAFRGARWSDVRRLNKEGYNITMKRVLNGQEYSLPPNDLRFALTIPQYEIDLSGIQQNPR